MHRAERLAATPTVPPRHRGWLLLAWLAPWLWSRALDPLAQRAAGREDCAFLHLGPRRLVVHLPEGSFSVPWRRVQAEREGLTWRLEAAGLVMDLVDEHLSDRERRRLRASGPSD